MARRLALITGASAGIGAAFAEVLAAHGYDVALTARRLDRLEALADDLRRRHGIEAYTIAADLAEATAPTLVLAALAAQGRAVDALVNNAGYGLTGTFGETAWRDQAAFIRVMMTAPSELAHGVLSGMRERRFGRIVNVASLAGLLPPGAGHTLYGAVKAYLIRFSQALHLENADASVHVTALCPGLTFSEFHDVNDTRAQMNRTPAWLWQDAETVARAGFAAVEANQAVCITGGHNKIIAAVARLLPENLALALMAAQSARVRRV